MTRLIAFTLLVLGAAQGVAFASPPGAPNVVASTPPPAAQWVMHEVIPGERLSAIADRYAVSTASIVRWNKLDPAAPRYRAGEKLRVQTRLAARAREKLRYVVRAGDSWAKIAQRFDVSQHALQHAWNDSQTALQPGQELTLWVEPRIDATADARGKSSTDILLVSTANTAASTTTTASTPALVPVPGTAQSVGRPDRGYLASGIQIPQNDALYSIRNPVRAYGSSHAVDTLQRSIASFRERSGYRGALVIGDMSDRDGGRFGPHRSHKSGRDVDIALPLRENAPRGATAEATGAVDWRATYRLIQAFAATGQVRYIFLSRSRQMLLYKAARAAGASMSELGELLQFPRKAKNTVVRHARGHTSHIHVRFKCGPLEASCQEI